MALEGATHPKIDNKDLEFTIEILDAQFNHEGWYFLELSVQSAFTKDFSGVQMRPGDQGRFLLQHRVQTDFTEQKESSPLSFFRDKKFTFRLPKGFCKNDKNHDVYLLVEAYTAPSRSKGRGQKVGEGKFPIYPRPNAPRINLYSNPGEDFYRYTDVMSLLRTISTDNIQMHCGRIRNTYSLREPLPERKPTPPELLVPKKRVVHSPKPKPSPPPPNPRSPTPPPKKKPEVKQRDPTPPSSWGDNFSLNLPSSPPLPIATESRRIPESPLPDRDRHTFYLDRAHRHVAEGGREQIDVILHGAASLPLSSEGRVPQPYGVVKLKKDDDLDKKTGAPSHRSVRPTHAPSWEEMVSIYIQEEKSGEETLVAIIADHQTHKGLVFYRIPISYLTPFHQYHLELNMPARNIPGGIRAFATITRKVPRLPSDPSSPNYLALEVLLQSVQRPIRSPLGPLIAVARVIPDYYNYKSDNLLSHPRTAGVTLTSVTFPDPHPSSFSVPPRSFHGYPQVSLPGRPDNQPTWNYPYLFVEERDKATLFTPGAALVIEYYVASMAMTDQFWRMSSPVAFSAIQMDQEMYKHLTADRARHGLRVEGLPVQGSDMTTVDGKQPTVGMILRLITTEQPDSLVSVSNLEDIPKLDLFASEVPGYYRTTPAELEPNIPSVPSTPPDATTLTEADILSRRFPAIEERERTPPPPRDEGYWRLEKIRKRPMSPIKDGDLPPFDSMERVLPDYQYIFYDPSNPHAVGPSDRSPRRKETIKTEPSTDDLDLASLGLLDHTTKELGNYRSAVHKMGQDILALRAQVRDLENNNSNLRRDLAHYNDSSRLMIESAELDGLTKPEIMARYAAIKQTLSSQTSDLKTYKDRLQQLQNELIKRNDQEKKFLQLSKAHAAQQAVMQKMQEKLGKLKKLQDACKKQEAVIEKMERILEKHHRDRAKYSKDKASQEANEALLEENKRLRAQLDDLRDSMRYAGKDSGSDIEKLELYQQLERAEGRIAALERQLAENSRQWGKERADMSLKLNEAEHGFVRGGTGVVLHDYPIVGEKYTGRRTHLNRTSPVYR